MAGWMQTEDLVFGDNALHVEREKIRISSEQVLIPSVESFIGFRAVQLTEGQFSSCLIIGDAETNQKYAIVYYLPDGDVGMLPVTSLGNGNG